MTTPNDALTRLVERLRAKKVSRFVPDSSKFIGLRREEDQDLDCQEAADHLTSLSSRCAELERERDEALMAAEGPSTLRELAAGSIARGFRIHELEGLVAEYERVHQGMRMTVIEECAKAVENVKIGWSNGPNYAAGFHAGLRCAVHDIRALVLRALAQPPSSKKETDR